MTKSEDQYIAALSQEHSDAQSDALIELVKLAREEPEAAWRKILGILGRDPPEAIVGLICAGPLEDLLQIHGRDFIDRVEVECTSNPTIAQLLNGIYRGDIDDDTWNRIVKISGRERQMWHKTSS